MAIDYSARDAILNAVAVLVERLLSVLPDLTVLVTSRTRLAPKTRGEGRVAKRDILEDLTHVEPRERHLRGPRAVPRLGTVIQREQDLPVLDVYFVIDIEANSRVISRAI